MIPALALATLPLLSMLACSGGEDDTAAICCSGDSAADGGADTGSGITATPWELVSIDPVSDSLQYVDTARQVIRASGNDFLYIVNADGSDTRTITPSYLQPEGDVCLGDPSGQPQSYNDCTFTPFSAGRITTSESRAVCLDDVDDRLYFVKEGGGRLEVAGTTRAGTSWAFYNRIYGTRTVIKEDGDVLEGPCAARGGRIAMSSTKDIVLLQDSDAALEIAQRISYDGGLLDLQFVGESKWLVAHGMDGSVWTIDAETGEYGGNLAPAGDAEVIAVDHDRWVVWIARAGDGRLVRVPLTENGAGTPSVVAMCGRVEDMAVDSRTGAVHALTACSDSASGFELVIASREGVHAALPLDDTPLALLPPGNMGHLGVVVKTQPTYDSGGAEIPAEVQLKLWHVVDPADARPPLNLWIATTLEQPFSANPKTCTEAENPGDNFEQYLWQLRENVPELKALGLPVAVGVTWEFLNNLDYCDAQYEALGLDEIRLEAIVALLKDAGFELGYMIHDRPCYSCTDGAVANENPDTCGPTDYDYEEPNSSGACWPSNENYCAKDDVACWFDFTNAKQLDVDRWLGGSKFIFGADRHWLYGWEYIQNGYRVFDRADGSKGYDTTFFQGNWVYPDITEQEDPRAKDPAPWNPELLGNTWFPAHCEDWEEDSAFSELVYMPGNSIAISRVYDMAVHDLTKVHLAEEFSGISTEPDDFETLTGLLAQAVAHRTDRVGTFYFHLADVTGYPMVSPDGKLPDYVTLIPDWAAQVDSLYGEDGLGVVKWGLPSEARAEVDAWLAAQE